MSDVRLVPAGNGESEYVEKRSSFLGHLRRVETEEEARAFIAEMKRRYHDARHNCWCYICGGAERYSDDGEPQGTAGIPMLEVFRKEGVSSVVCVVTRYFGGILLGAGGLLRAYTKAASDALSAAGIEELVPKAVLLVNCPYSLADRIRIETLNFGAELASADYGAEVAFRAVMKEDLAEKYIAAIFDMSSGTVLPVVEDMPSTRSV